MISGGPYSGFREGWALPMSFARRKVAHWLKRDEAGVAWASCGVGGYLAGRLLHVGTWTACKRCAARHGEPDQATRDECGERMRQVMAQVRCPTHAKPLPCSACQEARP